MNQERPQSRRVVTKGRYITFLGKKVAYFSTFSLFAVMTLICGGMFLVMLGSSIAAGLDGDIFSTFLRVIGIVFFGGCTEFTGRYTMLAWKELDLIEPVVPLTRHNTGDLPEEESLVRASEAPPAYQSDVLLRAAQGSQETPQEQLLRPVDKYDP